ncbi:MAG: hypothetical protein JAY88_14665 [Candidatus Thiodiazotropha lotti]|nr:hypothetical protein [Candidatus Thiodiazotropha lotti]MCW4188306.1 hypothetical protein [Candidatus Thiodiazotropha lotti]
MSPVLRGIGVWSPSAEALMMGTAAVESQMGRYLHQVGGPALGVMQMEPATHNDIIKNYLMHRQLLWRDVVQATGVDGVRLRNLTTNLAYAVAMARLHYLRVPEPLPKHDDIVGLGSYWKEHYNTHLGKGTVDKFVDSYHQLVEGNQ